VRPELSKALLPDVSESHSKVVRIKTDYLENLLSTANVLFCFLLDRSFFAFPLKTLMCSHKKKE